MKTIYLNLKAGPGKKVKVIQKGLVPAQGIVYAVADCKNRADAILTLSHYLRAAAMGSGIDDLLDVDIETYATLKLALRRVKAVE